MNNYELSDILYKKEIKPIENPNKILSQMRGIYYKRKDLKDNKRYIGVIGQEIKRVLPEVVEEVDNKKNVNYGKIVCLLIECIKQNNEDIEILKNNIELLMT